MPRSPGGPVEKEDAKICRACVCSGADNGGEKRNALIVRVLLPIAIDLARRRNVVYS